MKDLLGRAAFRKGSTDIQIKGRMLE